MSFSKFISKHKPIAKPKVERPKRGKLLPNGFHVGDKISHRETDLIGVGIVVDVEVTPPLHNPEPYRNTTEMVWAIWDGQYSDSRYPGWTQPQYCSLVDRTS